MTMPAMDRPSVWFAKFLDSVVIHGAGDPDHLRMECDLCGDLICHVEPNDTLRVLLNTALAHEC
jgi:hypothetical protein